MSKILTAEEFYDHFYNEQEKNNTLDGAIWEYKGDIINMMKEFAKLHVQQALKEASEKSYAISSNSNITSKDRLYGKQGLICVHLGDISVEKESILNAYPLNNIK